MQVGGGADIDDVDIRPLDDLFPVRFGFFPAPIVGKFTGAGWVLTAGNFEHRLEPDFKEFGRIGPGVAVGFTHKFGADDGHVYGFHETGLLE